MKNAIFVIFAMLICFTYSCEEDPIENNSCNTIVCQNGGTCNYGECDCPIDYIGDNCETLNCDYTPYYGPQNCNSSGYVRVSSTSCCPIDFPYYDTGSQNCYASCYAASTFSILADEVIYGTGQTVASAGYDCVNNQCVSVNTGGTYTSLANCNNVCGSTNNSPDPQFFGKYKHPTNEYYWELSASIVHNCNPSTPGNLINNYGQWIASNKVRINNSGTMIDYTLSKSGSTLLANTTIGGGNTTVTLNPYSGTLPCDGLYSYHMLVLWHYNLNENVDVTFNNTTWSGLVHYHQSNLYYPGLPCYSGITPDGNSGFSSSSNNSLFLRLTPNASNTIYLTWSNGYTNTITVNAGDAGCATVRKL